MKFRLMSWSVHGKKISRKKQKYYCKNFQKCYTPSIIQFYFSNIIFSEDGKNEKKIITAANGHFSEHVTTIVKEKLSCVRHLHLDIIVSILSAFIETIILRQNEVI